MVGVGNNITLVYYKIGNFNRGLTYYKKLQPKLDSLQNYHDGYLSHLNASLCYSFLREKDSARLCIQNALLARPGLVREANLIYTHCVGKYYHLFGNYDSARIFYRDLLRDAEEQNDNRFRVTAQLELIDLDLKEGKLNNVTSAVPKVERMIGASYLKAEAMMVYRDLAEVFKKLGNHEKQALYQEKAILVHDSLFGERFVNRLVEIESVFITEQKRKQFAFQQDILLMNDRIISQQRTVVLLTATVSILLALILGSVYLRYRHSKRANKILDGKISERTIELQRLNTTLKQVIE